MTLYLPGRSLPMYLAAELFNTIKPEDFDLATYNAANPKAKLAIISNLNSSLARFAPGFYFMKVHHALQ